MEAEFRAPKRRPRVFEVYEAPFPLNQNQFRAELINQQVLVQNPDHIRTLYSQGFFGKGILSRSGPVHSVSDRWENLDGVLLPVVSFLRYSELLQWAGQTLAAQGLDEASVRQRLERDSSVLTVDQVRIQIQSRSESSPGLQLQNPNEDQPESRGPESRGPESRGPESRGPESRGPESRGPESRGPGAVPDPGISVPGSGFVLVRSDAESEPRIHRVPLSVTEFLQLSHEEAFFLVYALGVLTIYHRQVPLSVLQLWNTFRSFSSDFVSFYAAYHFYRSRGWVPKTGSGAKYGSHMMLYRKGPPFFHSSFSVLLQTVKGAGPKGAGPVSRLSWRSLSALARVTANVSKELLLCYIIFPLDQSEAELESPDCLRRISVQELIVSRWVSSKERSDQEQDQI